MGADYVAFAREALDAAAGEPMLDAGCGSILLRTSFTALPAGRSSASINPLRILRRARARLIQLAGSVPSGIIPLQADLTDTVFRPRDFQSILCMNVLHQFENAAELVPKLRALLTNSGQLFLTSLVSNGRYIGDRWLSLLHKSG